jgi:hypothetical protein
MCLRRAPEKYIAGAALDRAGLGNVGPLTSHNPIGLHFLLRGQFYFTLLYFSRGRTIACVFGNIACVDGSNSRLASDDCST